MSARPPSSRPLDDAAPVRRDWRLPALLVAVAVLLINDHVLKAALGTWWTGKLSDFAGLFAFALFWSLLFPRRRWTIAAVTAIGFVFWKSPASQPLVDAINAAGLPFRIGRVVDWTDGIALLVLPVAALMAARGAAWAPRRVRDLALAGVSLFAFAATDTMEIPSEASTSQLFEYDEPYAMPAPQERVAFEIVELGAYVQVSQEGVYANTWIGWHDCGLYADAAIEPGDSASSTLRLMFISHDCRDVEGGEDPAVLQGVFEDSIVTPLRARLQ